MNQTSPSTGIWKPSHESIRPHGLDPMNFLIADTFQSSLARLSGQEQKAAKTAAFDLQLDPKGKVQSLHRLYSACDKVMIQFSSSSSPVRQPNQ